MLYLVFITSISYLYVRRALAFHDIVYTETSSTCLCYHITYVTTCASEQVMPSRYVAEGNLWCDHAISPVISAKERWDILLGYCPSVHFLAWCGGFVPDLGIYPNHDPLLSINDTFGLIVIRYFIRVAFPRVDYRLRRLSRMRTCELGWSVSSYSIQGVLSTADCGDFLLEKSLLSFLQSRTNAICWRLKSVAMRGWLVTLWVVGRSLALTWTRTLSLMLNLHIWEFILARFKSSLNTFSSWFLLPISHIRYV